MKRWMLALALLFVFSAGPALAVVNVQDDSVDKGDAVSLDFVDNFDVTGNYSTKTVNFSNNSAQKAIPWSPDEFALSYQPNVDDTYAYTPLSTSTTPSLRTRAASKTGFVRWADGNETRIQKKFRVPTDYKSGGAFRVLIGQSGAGENPPAIDYEVFVDRTGAAFDTAATNQTPSQINTVGNGSVEQKTLAVTTDFASLAAGDFVTVNFWRDDTTPGTSDLELYYAEFYYSLKTTQT